MKRKLIKYQFELQLRAGTALQFPWTSLTRIAGKKVKRIEVMDPTNITAFISGNNPAAIGVISSCFLTVVDTDSTNVIDTICLKEFITNATRLVVPDLPQEITIDSQKSYVQAGNGVVSLANTSIAINVEYYEEYN